MNFRRIPIFFYGLLAACSPTHFFEVPSDDAQRATITIYGETTTMRRAGKLFVARRDGADGSGEIDLIYADGHRVRCSIGYVAARDSEPHRFGLEGQQCREL